MAMAFEQSFLMALLLLVTGSGLLKGNISAQVGALYPRDEEARRTRGFAIFSTGINIGAVTGPLFCGLLAQVYGWHFGFGVAGIFMLAGLATYLYGYRDLPARVAGRHRQDGNLTAHDRRTTFGIVAVLGIAIFQSISHAQIYNVFPVWTQQSVALQVAGYRVPVPWFLSLESLSSILAAPLLILLWRWQASRRREPDDLLKIGIGACLSAASNLILVAGILGSAGALIHPVWPTLYCAGTGIAFMYYWPTSLALISRTAPARVNATMMGFAFMTLFIASNLVGWIGSFYERMTPAAFWAIHAAIAATGGFAVLLSRRSLRQWLGAAEALNKSH